MRAQGWEAWTYPSGSPLASTGGQMEWGALGPLPISFRTHRLGWLVRVQSLCVTPSLAHHFWFSLPAERGTVSVATLSYAVHSLAGMKWPHGREQVHVLTGHWRAVHQSSPGPVRLPAIAILRSRTWIFPELRMISPSL